MSGEGTALGVIGLGLVIILLLNVTLGGVCTRYCFEFYGTKMKGEPVEIAFWKAAIVGLFVGEFTIPGAIVTVLIVKPMWK